MIVVHSSAGETGPSTSRNVVMPSQCVRFEVAHYRAGERHLPHAHPGLQISVVLRGGVAERVARQTENARELSVVVKDPGVVHEDVFDRSDTVMASLGFPDATLADLVERRESAMPWRWTHDPCVAAPFLSLVSRSKNGIRNLSADDDDITDLVAAITARRTVSNGEPPAWLRVIVAEITDAWHPGLSVGSLARSANVHPVYLARSMRRWYGHGVAEAIRRSRIRHATQGIARAASTVSTIAHDDGFADEAHLCREFARTTGLTPGRYRRLITACLPNAGFENSSRVAYRR